MTGSNIVKAIPMATFASASVTGTYQAMNTGLAQACYGLRITNNSSQPITISFDGSTDNEFLINGQPFNSFPINSTDILWKKGQIVYIKGTAGTGNIYLSGYYF